MAQQLKAPWTTKIILLLLGIGMATVPFLNLNQFWLNTFIMAHLTGAFVASWDFLAGPVGQLSGGHALSLGGTAYAAATAGIVLLFNPWASAAVGLLVAAAVGLLAGLLSFRVRGPFLILATLALAEIAHELSLVAGFVSEQGYAIGGEGGIPLQQIVARGTEGFYQKAYVFTALLLVAIVTLLYLLANSRFGLQLKAAGQDMLSAEAIGIDTARFRLTGFIIASLAAGIVGLVWGQFVGRVTPSMLTLQSSFGAMVLAVIGGRGSIIGPAVVAYIGTAVFAWLWLDPHYQQLVYATVLLVLIRLRSSF